MTNRAKALGWAAIIIAAAVAANAMGMDDNASLAVILGLTGAAWASLYRRRTCSVGCN